MNFEKLHDLFFTFLIEFVKDLGAVPASTIDDAMLREYLERYVNPPVIAIFNGLTRPSKKDHLFAALSYYRGELKFERVPIKGVNFVGKPIEMPAVAVIPTLALTADSPVIVAALALFQYIRCLGADPKLMDKTAIQEWHESVTGILLDGFNQPDGYWGMQFHYITEPTAMAFTITIPLEPEASREA